MSVFVKTQAAMDTEVEYVAEFLWRVSIVRLDQPAYQWPCDGSSARRYRELARRLLQELADRERADVQRQGDTQ